VKLLDRYILRTFAATLVSVGAAMIGLYLVLHLFTHVGDLREAEVAFASRGLGIVGGLAGYYAAHLPEVAVFFGPYAILLAGMYTLYHLNQNNELVPMFAVGVSRLRAAAPIFVASGMLAILLMGMKQEVIPALARDMVFYNRLLKGQTDWVDNSLPIFQDAQKNVFDCRRWDAETMRLEDVWLSTAAGELVHFDAMIWTGAEEGGSWRVEGARPRSSFDPVHETDLLPADLEMEQRSRNRLSFNELRRITSRRPDRRDLEVVMQSHITYALSPIVLLLLGLPLVMRHRTRNVFANLGLCVVLSLAYFCATLLLGRLGAQGEVLSPFLGAWLPVILFGSVGLVSFEAASG
jgi:lipopolysaccharide export LptBFGC system permease protein LptF